MQRNSIQLAFVIAVAGIILFLNLGSARLWDRDEPRNAGCAAEMMQRGDWIVPMFNDELRHQKPVLLYWLIGSAYAVFGINEFAARFWSSALALGTVVLTYGIGRRLLDHRTATMGAMVLATSLMFVVAGRAATPDSTLIFCQTLALAIYVWGTFAPKKRTDEPPNLRVTGEYFPKSVHVAVAMYAVMGLGFLAKGIIGVVMPMAIIGMYMLIQSLSPADRTSTEGLGSISKFIVTVTRPFWPKHFWTTFLKMKPGLAVTIVLLVAGPWFVLVGMRTDGEFLKLFFLNEHFGRATTVFENHSGGFWYYPLAILLGFFPWSVFFVPMLLGIDRRLSRQHPQSTAIVFLLCWVCVQVGIFSLVSTKLPSYVTPCFPALALCCGNYIEKLWREKNRVVTFLDKAVLATIGLAGVGLVAGLAILCARVLNGSYWLVALGLVWLIVALAGWWLTSRQGSRAWIAVFTSAAVLFCVGLFGYGALSVDRTQQVSRLLDSIRRNDAPVATFRCLESSWIFYSGKPIFELATSPQSADATLDRKRFWEPKARVMPSDFAKQNPSALIITTEQSWFELQKQLPPNYRIVQTVPYFLRNKNLLLAAPAERIASQSPSDRTVN